MKVINRKPKNKRKPEIEIPYSVRLSDLQNLPLHIEYERNFNPFLFHNPTFVPWWNDFHLNENNSNE